MLATFYSSLKTNIIETAKIAAMTTNSRIHALPLHLANQIAAGEVIERPASVVKELIENSLDAGATEIIVTIEGAGSQNIQIRDNGHGIHPDDLKLALSRHATSKLHSTEQLSHIASLGFRGEALPSIASISRLTISSKQAHNDHAWQLNASTDELIPTAHPQGTTVEVRELFFNVPARRRFLRGDKTELNHITTTLHRLALSQFDIGFQCQLSASSSLKLPRATTLEQQQQRIAKICGKPFLTHSLYIEQDYDDIKLQGWLVNADGHRPQTDVHHFFINGRVIRDRVINHAIRQAYSDYIPAGRYPAFVLYLTMPLDRVDINVHPTKHEVRFRDARLIHGLINKAIKDALGKQLPSREIKPDLQPNKDNATNHQHQVAEPKTNYQSTPLSATNRKATFGDVIGLLSQQYVLIQSQQGPALIDLQQAEKELRQQQFQHAISTNTLSSRPILVPLKLSLTQTQLDVFTHYQTQFSALGLSYLIEEKHLVIKAIPSLFSSVDIQQLMLTLSSALSTNTSPEQLIVLMQQQLPTTHIQSMEQAQQLITQISTLPTSTKWCRHLDESIVDKLFHSL